MSHDTTLPIVKAIYPISRYAIIICINIGFISESSKSCPSVECNALYQTNKELV